MRTIETSEIKNISKIIKKIKFNSVPGNKSTLFFPLTEGATVDNGMFEMTVKSDKYSATPGLIVGRFTDSKDLQVFLAYTNPAVSPKINLIQYLEITGTKLSKNELAELTALDCYLVNTDNIFAQFII